MEDEEARVMSNLEQQTTDVQRTLTSLNVQLLESGKFSEAKKATELLEEFRLFRTKATDLFRTSTSCETGNPATSKPTPETTYPRYERRGRDLVKIGKRRGGESEYEQRCHREAWDEIIEVLGRVGTSLEKFSAQRVTEIASVPSYQVYLVIGFLQEVGLLRSPSRGDYKLEPEFSLGTANNEWDRAGV